VYRKQRARRYSLVYKSSKKRPCRNARVKRYLWYTQGARGDFKIHIGSQGGIIHTGSKRRLNNTHREQEETLKYIQRTEETLKYIQGARGD
jgi:hypothetical protein